MGIETSQMISILTIAGFSYGVTTGFNGDNQVDIALIERNDQQI